MNNIKHRGSKNTAENYKGIPIHAATGVHQEVTDILKLNVPPGSTVADIGAGDGALSLRLFDSGFKVEAFDFDNSSWEVKEFDCRLVNVENGVDQIIQCGPYKAICAIEIIEHLENPRKFLAELLQIARATGALIVISTPNPLDTFSAITVFTRGVFNWFGPDHYSGGGHISILPHWMIAEHLKYLGVKRFSWKFCAPYRHPSFVKRVVFKLVTFLRRVVSKSEDVSHFDGQTTLFTIYPD